VTVPVYLSYDTRETVTVYTLISTAFKALLSVQFKKRAFIKRIESELSFKEIAAFLRRLTTPALFNISRRT